MRFLIIKDCTNKLVLVLDRGEGLAPRIESLLLSVFLLGRFTLYICPVDHYHDRMWAMKQNFRLSFESEWRGNLPVGTCVPVTYYKFPLVSNWVYRAGSEKKCIHWDTEWKKTGRGFNHSLSKMKMFGLYFTLFCLTFSCGSFLW